MFRNRNIFESMESEPIEISLRKNDEVTEDLKTLLHEVRSLITSFQAHVSQTATPAKSPS
ncbi:hypothetical protein ACROYT_G020196 [Oculina patagonica]